MSDKAFVAAIAMAAAIMFGCCAHCEITHQKELHKTQRLRIEKGLDK